MSKKEPETTVMFVPAHTTRHLGTGKKVRAVHSWERFTPEKSSQSGQRIRKFVTPALDELESVGFRQEEGFSPALVCPRSGNYVQEHGAEGPHLHPSKYKILSIQYVPNDVGVLYARLEVKKLP